MVLKAPPENNAEWADDFNVHTVQEYYANPDNEDGLPDVLRGQHIKDVVAIARKLDLGPSVKVFVKGIGLASSSISVGGGSTVCDLVAWKKPEVKKKAVKAP